MTRTLRISTGLILFAFVAMHLANLSLGVISVDLVAEYRYPIMFIWSNPVGGMLLIASSMVHMVLGFQVLYQRNTLRMPAQDAIQFLTAFIIPPLMIPHVWGVIAVKEFMLLDLQFMDLFRLFWIDQPLEGLRQVLLVIAVWVHGCVGLFTWFKLKPWWPKISNYMYPLAVAIPVLALLGFVEGGKQAIELVAAGTPGNMPGIPVEEIRPTLIWINQMKLMMVQGYLFILLAVLAARLWRMRGRDQIVEVHYADGRVVKTKVGPTLLEIANLHDVPHANICRGRGRCGTCRVLIHSSENELAVPSDIERATLARLDSPSNTRLACQIAPASGVIHIERLLPPDIRPDELHGYGPAVATAKTAPKTEPKAEEVA